MPARNLFVRGISEGNPIFPLIHNCVVKSTAQYALRSKKNPSHPRVVWTDRFADFVTVKYQFSCGL